MRHQESVARHDTSKAPDDLEAMRLKIAKLESEEVNAKTAYRESLDKLEDYKEKYRGEFEIREMCDDIISSFACAYNVYVEKLEKKISYGSNAEAGFSNLQLK